MTTPGVFALFFPFSVYFLSYVLLLISLPISQVSYELSRRKDSVRGRYLLVLISAMFILSMALWIARFTTDIIQVAHLASGTSDTTAGMSSLNDALSAVDMTNALSLINASNSSCSGASCGLTSIYSLQSQMPLLYGELGCYARKARSP